MLRHYLEQYNFEKSKGVTAFLHDLSEVNMECICTEFYNGPIQLFYLCDVSLEQIRVEENIHTHHIDEAFPQYEGDNACLEHLSRHLLLQNGSLPPRSVHCIPLTFTVCPLKQLTHSMYLHCMTFILF